MKTENSFVNTNGHEPKFVREPVDLHKIVHDLKHYLPAQAPLKDFIHHNTLHAFQRLKFFDAIHHASSIFGYQVSLSVVEYRTLHDKKRVNDQILERVILNRKGAENLKTWKHKLLYNEYRKEEPPRIGKLRANWKKIYKIDLDSLVHTTLFRVICSYLDQGIAIWNFPVTNKGFLSSIREMERMSYTSLFRGTRAKKMLINGNHNLNDLLKLVVGDERLFKSYLFDQQFAHQGWSGLASSVEDQPENLLDRRNISLEEVIIFELLLEIDALDYTFENEWRPLGDSIAERPADLFEKLPYSEINEVLSLWQEAYEWSYYDQVLAGLQKVTPAPVISKPSFQAMFCIDDRECSFRRHLEKTDPQCETFSTPGFFSVEFYFQPEQGKFYTKLCPAPVTPKYLIKEIGSTSKRDKDVHFTKHSHTLFRGWLISQTLGFWSALRLFINIFKPSASPATASSFSHMDKLSTLTIEAKDPSHKENNLQVGFTVDEMATRVENLLKSIGLTQRFASVVYVVGHGASSVNNPHYAAYDCGACSGRPGSVNARVFCHMANHPVVRELLVARGIVIPEKTQFVGGLHDTTRDEVAFYDEDSLSEINRKLHEENTKTFHTALKVNSTERARRFDSISPKQSAERIHEKIRERAVSLFEPRPELNHATNALCIVGKRSLTKNIFLDRRSFLNSYDHKIDPEGNYLLNILKAAAPVCGGINLEYFFSRVDNQKLGAGTKLPHNVMGLFGVANGIEGDLRPGLPSQMIEVHDPVRLLLIVEHYPEVLLKTIQRHAETYEWFTNEWVHLVSIDPDTRKLNVFKDGAFEEYFTIAEELQRVSEIIPFVQNETENLPVVLMESL
jgi:uncharacterized protein YbcC (UPF0753/DUF2309 family)